MRNYSLAPIVLFTYNRLKHTIQTVEALRKNNLAKNSHLFIYSDGAKNEKTYEEVKKVREYIKTIDGFKTITIIERDKNYGLANNIIDGVTKIINEYEKIIVLEDDLITSQYFLTFMNDALNIYENSKEVGMINGHIYNISKLPKLFFSYIPGCLGWATWSKKWNEINFDGLTLLKNLKNENLISKFNINDSYPFLEMLENQIINKNNSWAIRVHASFILNNQLTFYPGKSLVQHIGIDQGTHCKGRNEPSAVDGLLSSKKIEAKNIEIKNSEIALKKLESFFYEIHQKLPKRFIDQDHLKLREIKGLEEIEVLFFNKKLKSNNAQLLLLLNYKIFELQIYKFITSSENPTIIDCTSNIGLSIIYFKMLYPKAKIIGFEENKEIFKYLKFNIKSFKFNKITLINNAFINQETTESINLDNHIDNNEIDLLKIDIDELKINFLINIQKYMSNIKNICIQYNSSNQNLSLILDILEKNNFKYYINNIDQKLNSPFLNNNIILNNKLIILGTKINKMENK